MTALNIVLYVTRAWLNILVAMLCIFLLHTVSPEVLYSASHTQRCSVAMPACTDFERHML